MYNILQIGMGPLGLKISQYIEEKSSMQTIAAVDIDKALLGKDLGLLAGGPETGTLIYNSISAVTEIETVDAIVLTTSSSLHAIAKQLDEILDYGIPVVSTCEELTFPWERDPTLATGIDNKAKLKNVAVVSTGVNPGFLMDTLPAMLTSVCREVKHITVNRFQDARTRRLPFQKKIGAGLTLAQFDEKKKSGTLRHVGLAESMHFIAKSVGWELDEVADVISPIIAKEDIQTEAMQIEAGYAMGVRQIGTANFKGEEKIRLVFEAAVGSGISYDEVKIKGTPDINSKIDGGVHGDIATCSIVLNAIPKILKSTPGLKTMADIPIVSYCP